MKVQCDVCAAEAASVFCCADEAALCDACDRHVHRANKLAGKHRRLSLLHPSPSPSDSSPPCDICQEKTGLLFCKEDRAILCQECDIRVHTTNDLTRRHSRYLLTGVRVSPAPVESPLPSYQEEESSSRACNAADSCGTVSATASAGDSSSISEYLTKTLPGWHVEDFLLDASDKTYQGGLAGIGGLHDGCPAWAGAGAGGEQLLGDVVAPAAERARRALWVPQMHAEVEWAGSKPSRASSSHYTGENVGFGGGKELGMHRWFSSF